MTITNVGKTPGILHQTMDYSAFHIMPGNRAVRAARVNKIIGSIKSNGWVTNPIVVNENMEIIDGQGRLEALKQLGLPVEYIVVPGTGLKDCVVMNASSTNWSVRDYIASYADMGDVSYQWLNDMSARHPKIGVRLIAGIAVGNIGRVGNDTLKNGEFSVDSNGMLLAERLLAVLERFVPMCLALPGQTENYLAVIAFAVRDCCANVERLYERFRDASNTIGQFVNIRTGVSEIEKLYNYRLPVEQRIYMTITYDQMMAKVRNEASKRFRGEVG